VLIVCVEVALVEARLVGGLSSCPSCREVLRPWGHALAGVAVSVGGSVVAATAGAVSGVRGHARVVAADRVAAPSG
jgi:hypothetical protein